ncbi:MAG: Branched-chain amino acid ABC-type transport system, permease component [Ilumatobacteraceae bacterium]|nr:Branched-chain amino acid ABC-type transport system, permease component [Ilumatobacteraceae bacterium]
MDEFGALLVFGLASAAIYAVAASGLVVTYQTSGIFNFAHGAVAMWAAFVYWQLSSPDAWGLPVWLSLVLTLLVFAPAFGFLIDRVLMRRLHDASPITRIVVPIGLLVALIQLATVVWSPAESRNLPRFFEGDVVRILGVGVDYHQIVVFVVAILVAVFLRILLYRTRVGVAMRAVVDSRDLAGLTGASPDRISSLSWAVGCTLAAVAGVLIAPILTLDQTTLTLLVINAYAAAVVGRLRSLPLTVVGAVILGLLREAASRYSTDINAWMAPGTEPGWVPDGVAGLLHTLAGWINVETVPVIMLFIALLVLPQEKASLFNRQPDRSRVPNPSLRNVSLACVALVAAAFFIPSLLSGAALDAVGYGLALSIVALSLVPLMGYGGQISLAPLAFAGIGAVVMYRWGSDGNPLALIGVVVICGVVGALVALPAIRLKGLYLALSTMAFALFCEKAVFAGIAGFAQGDATYERLHLGPIDTSSNRANLVLMAVVFALLGLLVTVLRRGPFGRRLQAMKDSPAACATLGLDLTRLKLQVFALSAAIAGLGGALLGGWRGKVGTEQFALLQGALPGLPLVLMAVVGGIAAIAGVLLGAMLYSMFPLIGETYPALKNLMTILPGLAGISLAANPDGAIAQTVDKVRAQWAKRHATGPDPDRNRAVALLAPPAPEVAPELVLAGGAPLTLDEIAAIDAETGLSWGRCHADPRDA